MNRNHDTIGDLIATARHDRDDSYRKAALALGVGDKMVKQWEMNFAIPTWDRATSIADYCGVSRAYVLRLLGIIDDDELGALGGSRRLAVA